MRMASAFERSWKATRVEIAGALVHHAGDEISEALLARIGSWAAPPRKAKRMAIRGLAWLSTSQASMPPGLVTRSIFMASAWAACGGGEDEETRRRAAQAREAERRDPGLPSSAKTCLGLGAWTGLLTMLPVYSGAGSRIAGDRILVDEIFARDVRGCHRRSPCFRRSGHSSTSSMVMPVASRQP